MRSLPFLSVVFAALVIFTTPATATVTVSVPDYPSLSQLESGWNTAFTTLLTDFFGTVPVITSTTTYAGTEGQIVVVSTYTVGTTSGSILGLAFNPYTATALGGGAYTYEIQHAPFTCTSGGSCSSCEPHDKVSSDGSYERWCKCNSGSGCTLVPLGAATGLCKIRPSDYGSLPELE